MSTGVADAATIGACRCGAAPIARHPRQRQLAAGSAIGPAPRAARVATSADRWPRRSVTAGWTASDGHCRATRSGVAGNHWTCPARAERPPDRRSDRPPAGRSNPARIERQFGCATLSRCGRSHRAQRPTTRPRSAVVTRSTFRPRPRCWKPTPSRAGASGKTPRPEAIPARIDDAGADPRRRSVMHHRPDLTKEGPTIRWFDRVAPGTTARDPNRGPGSPVGSSGARTEDWPRRAGPMRASGPRPRQRPACGQPGPRGPG